MNKEFTFNSTETYQETGNSLNKKNEPSVDTTSINTYWNTVLDSNDKSIKFYRSIYLLPNVLTRNSLGLIEANTVNQTNNVYVPLIGLIANDTGSYFQTLDTDFTFFEFEQKIRTENVQVPSRPQTVVVTTYFGSKSSDIDVLFYAPEFNGGTPVLFYEYALSNGINSPGYNAFLKLPNSLTIGYQNQIITPNDTDFRYIFSFDPQIIQPNIDYILQLRAVNTRGASKSIDITFKPGTAAVKTVGNGTPIKQKR